MLHELMTRTGFYLPSIKCRYCTLKTLLKIREGQLWCLKQEHTVLRACTRPPSIRVLVEKLHSYLAPHNLKSGIDLDKENFPDKGWLIIAVASTSNGRDEIFGKEYVPTAAQMLKNPPEQIMVHNNDGLLNVPDKLAALYNKKGTRCIQMVTLTKEEKIRAKMALSQQKMDQHAAAQIRMQE